MLTETSSIEKRRLAAPFGCEILGAGLGREIDAPTRTVIHDAWIVWDNWRIIHSAAGVPLDCSRIARRTTIAGDYKVGRDLDASLDGDRKVKRPVD